MAVGDKQEEKRKEKGSVYRLVSVLSRSVVVLFFLSSCSFFSSSEPVPVVEEKKRVRVSLSSISVEKKAKQKKPVTFVPVVEERIKKIKRYRKKRFIHHNPYAIQPMGSFAADSQEIVEIGGKIYRIPAVWQGQKITMPDFTRDSLLKLPAKYVHGDRDVYVKKEARAPLLAMMDAAAAEGIYLQVETAYRDIEAQKEIFLRKFRKGRSWEDVVRYVAPPGYSEHMLGLAVDFYPSGWKFATTDGYRWLQQNGKKYGFIESYPQTPIAGHAKIAWEAWHWFYIGVENKKENKAPLL